MAHRHKNGTPIAMALTAALAPSAYAQTSHPSDMAPLKQVEVGIVCNASTGNLSAHPAPETLTGQIGLGEDSALAIDVATTRVPARLGVGFGPQISLKQGTQDIVLRMQVTHPPLGLTGETRQSWDVPLEANGKTVALFVFEHSYELVPGDWVFRMYRGDKQVFEQIFDVYDPALNTSLSRPCYGKEHTA